MAASPKSSTRTKRSLRRTAQGGPFALFLFLFLGAGVIDQFPEFRALLYSCVFLYFAALYSVMISFEDIRAYLQKAHMWELTLFALPWFLVMGGLFILVARPISAWVVFHLLALPLSGLVFAWSYWFCVWRLKRWVS